MHLTRLCDSVIVDQKAIVAAGKHKLPLFRLIRTPTRAAALHHEPRVGVETGVLKVPPCCMPGTCMIRPVLLFIRWYHQVPSMMPTSMPDARQLGRW